MKLDLSNYYLDLDGWNATLYRKYTTTNKEGEVVEKGKRVGYYNPTPKGIIHAITDGVTKDAMGQLDTSVDVKGLMNFLTLQEEDVKTWVESQVSHQRMYIKED